MSVNASDQRWTKGYLGKMLHVFLGKNSIICQVVVADISEMIEGLRKDLKQFGVFWDRESKMCTSHATPVHNVCRVVKDVAN